MLKTNIPLKDYSNFKTGGPAAYFLEVTSDRDLIQGLREFKREEPVFILGKGTNVLIGEDGFKGLIIYDNIQGIKNDSGKVTVGAGVLISDLLNFCIQNNLTGLEWAGGLPGTVGGAVRGNAGAFGGETKDFVSKVSSVNIKTLETAIRDSRDCEFSYRSSVFKTKVKDEMIVQVTFGLKQGDRAIIESMIREKADYRNLRHPMDLPSLGSTFKNVPVQSLSELQKASLLQYVKNDPFPVIPVAKLLYLCDLKGTREGDAQISEKHPNFIVNLGNAKSPDVKKLIQFAKDKIKQKFDISLEEEIMYL